MYLTNSAIRNQIMWQKIILQSKKNSPDKGFLTLEIIIATIVAFGFLMFSLQTLALAMWIKVEAQKDQRAEQLIQEEIERMGSLSNGLTLGLANQLENGLPTNCNVDNYDNGYARALWDALDDPDTIGVDESTLPATTQLFTGDAGGITLTLTRTNITNSSNNSIAPHRTLRLFYQVTVVNGVSDTLNMPGDPDDEMIASRIIEIIPEEALECP